MGAVVGAAPAGGIAAAAEAGTIAAAGFAPPPPGGATAVPPLVAAWAGLVGVPVLSIGLARLFACAGVVCGAGGSMIRITDGEDVSRTALAAGGAAAALARFVAGGVFELCGKSKPPRCGKFLGGSGGTTGVGTTGVGCTTAGGVAGAQGAGEGPGTGAGVV